MGRHQPPVRAGNILIVDDTPANLRLLSQMLTGQGYRVRAVTSGARAIESVKASPPDLILLDVMMPEMDGYQVCERLKADAETARIPIIFVSALDTAESKVRAFAYGGVDYVPKPFQPEEVLARVKTHLALRNLQSQLERANRELEHRVHELQRALDQVKTLSGLLPICANCKKVRDDQGYWHQVEVYIRDRSEAKFSHGLCPDCIRELYPDYLTDA